MSPNDRLRDALSAAGMTPDTLAARIGVDPKTVRRWIAQGRAPYPRHRHETAALVKESEAYLWPAAVARERSSGAAEAEVVHVYPHRAGIPRDLWAHLFSAAAERIDMLVYAALFLPEQQPNLFTDLCRQVGAGTDVRLLLGDPGCSAVARRGEEEGIGPAIPAKIRNVLSFLAPHREHGCIDVRLHRTTLYTSVYRFDREMLVNHHVLGLPAAHAPVMHLRQVGPADMFTTFADLFERVWSHSAPAWRQAVV
jgi:hypothetical protein